MIKRTLLFFILVSLGITISSFINEGKDEKVKKQKVIRTIVIDPGHGGSDAGAKGLYSYEKDICLAVSLKLGKMIQAEYPEVKLVYTRTTDSYPALHARANLANENKGDLFICVHVNSAPMKRGSEITGYKTVTYYTGKGKNRKKKTKEVAQYRYFNIPSTAKGTETYIWGAGKTDDKELAVRENSYIFSEENYEKNYGPNFDPNSPEAVAVALLKTKQYFKRSATLAGYIQDEFVKVGRIDRDVKQRPVGIWVLQATAMPSVLIETGFISNPEEEKYLNSESGQHELSDCVLKALKNYIKWLEDHQQTTTDDSQSGNGKTPAASDTKAFLEMVEKKEKQARSK
jgi:N-acetylmuramoyl-L-alanine amidase